MRATISALTHTIEVAQIARALARALGLDEDLAEALALAHDLGHTPFGHTGEDALADCMADVGGFDHNAQTLRIVTRLERRYAGFDGLNLTWETLEGLVKHNGPLLTGDGSPTERYAQGGIPAAIVEYQDRQDLWLDTYASAEAQVAALADDSGLVVEALELAAGGGGPPPAPARAPRWAGAGARTAASCRMALVTLGPSPSDPASRIAATGGSRVSRRK